MLGTCSLPRFACPIPGLQGKPGAWGRSNIDFRSFDGEGEKRHGQLSPDARDSLLSFTGFR